MTTTELKEIPQFVSREEVPLYFSTISKKMHASIFSPSTKGVGPLYNLVGRRAFYATEETFGSGSTKSKRSGPNY